MRKLKLGSVALGQIISDLQETSNFYTDEIIPYPLWVTNLNESVNELFELSGWRNLVDYRDSIVIPVVKKVYSNALVGSNYNGSLYLLTVPLTATWENGTGFDSYWIGAVGQITDSSTGLSYYAKIKTIIDSTTVVIQPKTPVPPTIIYANLIVNIDTSVNNETDEVDLTTIPFYKNLDKLEKITSTSVRNGLTVGGEDDMGRTKVTSKTFENMKGSSNYKDQIIWYRNGEVLRMSKGTNLTSYGTRTLYFTTYPSLMINDTDFIDVRDVDIPKVKKYCLIRTLGNLPQDKFKIALPQIDLDWVQTLQGSKQAQVEKKPIMN